MRRSSLEELEVGISREVQSEYDNIKIVADNIEDVNTVAAIPNLPTLGEDIADAVDTTNANVVLTNADVVTTNNNVAATNADVVLTNADVVLTHADVVLTGADVDFTNIDVGLTNADVTSTNADVVLTNADVVLTGADVDSTNADVVLTGADVDLTNADVVLTGADVDLTNADVVLTHADVVLTGADLVLTNADVVLTNADVVLTGADVDLTNADVVLTGADLDLTNADVVLTGADVDSTNADVVLTNADVVLANKWAEEVEDTEVDTGQYSALHWAAKAAGSVSAGILTTRYEYTVITTPQTTFTPTNGYVVGAIDVYLDGILLEEAAYTASNGTTVVLASAAAVGVIFKSLAWESQIGGYTHPTGDGSNHVPADSGTSSGKVLTASGTPGAPTWETAGAGDMIAATYDPTSVNGDAFDTDNHVDGTTNKVYTATEKTKLGDITFPGSAVDENIVVFNGTGGDSVKDSGLSVDIVKANQSTVHISGMDTTAGTGVGEISISAGTGFVTDAYTDPLNPITTHVVYIGVTDWVPTNILTWSTTYLMIDSAGLLVERQFLPTPEEKREYIQIGLVAHTDNVNITQIGNTKFSAVAPTETLVDMGTALGYITKDLINYSANGANLRLDKSAGSSFFVSLNYVANRKNPNYIDTTSATEEYFLPTWKNSGGDWVFGASTQDIVPGTYNDFSHATLPGGTVGANQYSIMRIYHSPDVDNLTIVQYAQEVYDEYIDALLNANLETFEFHPVLEAVPLRCSLIVKGDATDLSDLEVARFVNTAKNNDYTTAPTPLENLLDSIALKRYDTGVITGGAPSLNADITKIDIEATTYQIQGVWYTYAGITGYSPGLTGTESARRIGLDASGLVDQLADFSAVQKQTILPICRIQAVQGQSGAGSDLNTPLHQHFGIGESGYKQRIWHEEAIGALYYTGGSIYESSTALQLSENSGVFYNAQRERMEITGSSNIEAIEVYHVGGVLTLGTKAVLVCDNTQYDDGTNLVTMSTDKKWVSHTLLKSPKEESEFFLIYSPVEYNSQKDSEASEPYYGVFVSQAVSGLIAVASINIKRDSVNIDTIITRRPFIGGNVGAVLGTSNLQQTYDNSTSPEILTDATRGALTVQRGGAADTDNILEGKNGAGGTTFEVDGNGDVTANEFVGHVIGTDIQAYDADTAKLDIVQVFTAAQRHTDTITTYGASVSLNLSLSNDYTITLTGNLTLTNTFTDPVIGQSGYITLIQGGTGSYTLTIASYWKSAGGTDPTLTTAVGSVDVIRYRVRSATAIDVFFSGDHK